MTRRLEAIHPRQFGKPALAVHEFLLSMGVADAVFTKTTRVHAKFKIGVRQVTVSIPCPPRDETAAAKQAVRFAKQKITEACVQIANDNHQQRKKPNAR